MAGRSGGRFLTDHEISNRLFDESDDEEAEREMAIFEDERNYEFVQNSKKFFFLRL